MDTSAIDRVFDGVDNFVDLLDRVANRGESSPKAKAPSAPPPPALTPSISKALAQRRYKIIEATDSESGRQIWIVTDGYARAECDSRVTAEKILAALEAT